MLTTTEPAVCLELPTDCPQRDERLGWMGDARSYVRAATFHADVAAFFTKWLDDVEGAQRDFGAFPDYCPYPMAHGEPGQTFGAGCAGRLL
jgi:alpha-L-rhamnosidase